MLKILKKLYKNKTIKQLMNYYGSCIVRGISSKLNFIISISKKCERKPILADALVDLDNKMNEVIMNEIEMIDIYINLLKKSCA